MDFLIVYGDINKQFKNVPYLILLILILYDFDDTLLFMYNLCIMF